MDVHRLIEAVRKRPTLWDKQHPENRSRAALSKLWHEVANEINVNEGKCDDEHKRKLVTHDFD